MSAGGGNKTDPPVPPGREADADDDLVTSEDLFGNLVDSPLPPREANRTVRKDPIRVQVSDPVTPGPFAAVPEDQPGSPSAAPEDTPAPSDADEANADEVDGAFSRLGGLVAESIAMQVGLTWAAPTLEQFSAANVGITPPTDRNAASKKVRFSMGSPLLSRRPAARFRIPNTRAAACRPVRP